MVVGKTEYKHLRTGMRRDPLNGRKVQIRKKISRTFVYPMASLRAALFWAMAEPYFNIDSFQWLEPIFKMPYSVFIRYFLGYNFIRYS